MISLDSFPATKPNKACYYPNGNIALFERDGEVRLMIISLKEVIIYDYDTNRKISSIKVSFNELMHLIAKLSDERILEVRDKVFSL